ncbi:DUF3575 domain-containing protein [Bacteroides sp. 519]|uniref:DUF3575 domain-containing protein n=1 Tax=Bacteroides sp. 519 TaxID=2302937 RepID=UPI0013D15848|nr:DUF3575 domain-containing protein [Bacteroides sp. 519]NDV58284.1 DUF3575 domain-containing protein [Bacteroides sp. 519]
MQHIRIQFIFILVFTLVVGSSCLAQEAVNSYRLYNGSPRLLVKSNLFYNATASINLELEFKLSRRHTLSLPVNYNPFEFANNSKRKHLLVQPEFRHWLCESFMGHFLGIHAHYAYYNVGNINLFRATKEHRYQGWLGGAGVSWGYHWLLSPRWSLEFTVGLGYAYLDYDKYDSPKCGKLVKSDNRHYVGPTKVGLSLIYVIK